MRKTLIWLVKNSSCLVSYFIYFCTLLFSHTLSSEKVYWKWKGKGRSIVSWFPFCYWPQNHTSLWWRNRKKHVDFSIFETIIFISIKVSELGRSTAFSVNLATLHWNELNYLASRGSAFTKVVSCRGDGSLMASFWASLSCILH